MSKQIKGEIRFHINLNDEQKEAKRLILDNTVTVLKGAAGSGKTITACQVALDMLFKKEVDRIVICRPAISKEELGFLPGNASDKLQPYLQPVLDNFYLLYHKEAIDALIEDGKIQILPFAFMRGHTFTKAFIIADEAQNITFTLMELILGRIGMGSKVAICGDSTQIDLKDKKESGFDFISKHVHVPGFAVMTLKNNHRHPIVELLLQVFNDYK
jgi:phosphate starvation-inducible PhoH-like protein